MRVYVLRDVRADSRLMAHKGVRSSLCVMPSPARPWTCLPPEQAPSPAYTTRTPVPECFSAKKGRLQPQWPQTAAHQREQVQYNCNENDLVHQRPGGQGVSSRRGTWARKPVKPAEARRSHHSNGFSWPAIWLVNRARAGWAERARRTQRGASRAAKPATSADVL